VIGDHADLKAADVPDRRTAPRSWSWTAPALWSASPTWRSSRRTTRRRATRGRSAPTAPVRALLCPDAKRTDGGKAVAQRSFPLRWGTLVDLFAVPDRVGATAALAARLVGIAAAGEAPRGPGGLARREVRHPERRGIARVHARLAVARAQADVARARRAR